MYNEREKKLGFFSTLLAILGDIGMVNSNIKKQHNGICNGNCANFPPHYDYRYGRCYYGHDHTHGCQFGGNKGHGNKD